jgi:hypothetical protein
VSDEQQIATLREEIRGAGDVARLTRLTLGGTIGSAGLLRRYDQD